MWHTVDVVASGSAEIEGATPVARERVRTIAWRLVSDTVATCFRYRVTGLAAEAGFFALLSLPPLLLALVGSIGYLGDWVTTDTKNQVRQRIIEVAGQFLTADSVRKVIQPTLEQVLQDGRLDVLSVGFLISLWSGSRALNVFIDTISIMYGLGGKRGIIRSRLLSFSLYLVALVIGGFVVPLVLIGPDFLGRLLPDPLDFLILLYWPVASLLSIVSLTSLYHISVPVRTPWRRDLPGAFLTMTIWYVGSFVIRWVISFSVGGASIYGPLAAPIVVMIWLYVLAIAVLIGAALNAAVEKRWPCRELTEARAAVEPTPERRVDGLTGGRGPGGPNPLPNRPPAENPLAPVRDAG
jgi:membrane protein